LLRREAKGGLNIKHKVYDIQETVKEQRGNKAVCMAATKVWKFVH
jgi:hypothetical protein